MKIQLLSFQVIFYKNKKFIKFASQSRNNNIRKFIFIHKEPIFKESISFIKDVSRIQKFSINQGDCYLLSVTETPTGKTLEHLNFVKTKY